MIHPNHAGASMYNNTVIPGMADTYTSGSIAGALTSKPATSGEMDILLGRADGLVNRLQHIVKQAEHTADRIVGAVPQTKDAVGNPPSTGSKVGEMHERLSYLENLTTALGEAVERLSRL